MATQGSPKIFKSILELIHQAWAMHQWKQSVKYITRGDVGGSYYCPDCSKCSRVPDATHVLKLYSDNPDVRKAFPDRSGNSKYVVYPQWYCYKHYIKAFKRFNASGGICAQYIEGDFIDRKPEEEGLLPPRRKDKNH